MKLILLLLLIFIKNIQSLTYLVQASEKACFYVYVKNPGQKVAFYFAVQSGGSFDIDYIVHGPSSSLISSGSKERQTDEVFVAPTSGEYSFCFSNGLSSYDAKIIDFEISAQNDEFAIKAEVPMKSVDLQHLTPLETSLFQLSSSLSSIIRNQKYFRTREHRNFATVVSTESRIFYFAFTESILIVGMASLQPRKLDYRKRLPIYRAEELEGLDDDSHRAIPVVATGVEKEEETEHHLQVVMNVTRENLKEAIYIPTPNANTTVDYYDKFYIKNKFKMPQGLIRFSSVVEEFIGNAYCADDKDLEWLQEFNGLQEKVNVDQFETVFNELETITTEKQKKNSESFAEESDLESFLILEGQEIKDSFGEIYNYWKLKKIGFKFKSLMFSLKFEESGSKSEYDPFVCFRKREVKISRKTRRTDAQSMQRIKQLRHEMEIAKQLCDMVNKREKMRHEHLMNESAIFEQKVLIKTARIELGVPEDLFEAARTARKKAAKPSSSSAQKLSKIKRRKQSPLDEEYKEPYLKLVEEAVIAHRAANLMWENFNEAFVQLPSFAGQEFIVDQLGFDKINHRILPKGRCRIGRGGRVIFDNLRDTENITYEYDPSLAGRNSSHLFHNATNFTYKIQHQTFKEYPALEHKEVKEAPKKIKLKLQ